MRLLGLVLALILAAAQSGSHAQERRCDGDCSDKAPLPPGEGAATPSPPAAAAPADDKQRRPPQPPDEAKPPPPVESDVALHFTNHVHVTLNDTWDPPGHMHRDVVVENGSSLNYAASFLSHTVTDDDGEDVEPATPASVLNNTIALGEDGSKVKVLLDSSNNLKEADLSHEEDTARAAKVQTPSTAGLLEVVTTTPLPEAPEQQSPKNMSREIVNNEDRPPEIVVTQEPSKNIGTDLLPSVVVTEEPFWNNTSTSTSNQEHDDAEKAAATVSNNKTEVTTKPPSTRNAGDNQERRSSTTRLVIKKVTKAEAEDDEASSTPLPRENKIYHGSSRRRTQDVTTQRPRRRGTTTPQPEASTSTTFRSFRRKSTTDAASGVETTTTPVAVETRRRPSEEDSEETMVRVELSTLPPRRSSFRPLSTTTTTSSTVSISSSSVPMSRGRVKFSDSSNSRTTTTPSSASVSSSLIPMRRLLLPPTPSPGTRVQEPRPFSLGMQENKHVVVHVPAPPTTTEISTTEDFTTSSITVVTEDAWTREGDEDFSVTITTSSRSNTSSDFDDEDDDDAASTTTTWPMTTMATKSPDNANTNESDSTLAAITDPVTTDRPEEASTATVPPTERSETQQDGGEDGEDASSTLTTTVSSPYEALCYATLWASGEELCRRLTDVRDAFLAALKVNSQQDGDDDREPPPPSGWEMSLHLQEAKTCEGQEVTSRSVEVSVRGLPDGCMLLLDLWTADNLASPFQVRQFRVPGVEPPPYEGHSEDVEDRNTTTVSTTTTTTTTTTAATTTTSSADEDEKTTLATTTEEVPPPALSGGGGEGGSNAGVVAAIVVSSVGGVCLVLLAVLLVVLRRRQRRFRSYGQRCTPVSLDAYSLDSVSVGDAASVRSRRKGVLRASKRSYGNAAFTLDERDPASPSHPLTFAGLAAFCADDSAAIEAEFALVPQVSVASDELPPGADVKNRYANVTPLPETRVQLSRRGDDPISTYINANYVKGPEGEPKFYIATQAPMASTVTDFWRMVWEQQSRTILMATLLVENGVERCCDYLPPSEVLDCHRVFGDFQITLKKRDQKDHYVISTLQIKNLETNLWREVTHLWLVSWPCEGVPDDPRSVIAFLVEARPFTKAAGPVVVHCSPGTGRTGTLIACDVLLRHFEKTRTVDVPRCVAAIRRERAGAVKTPQQYVFIYKENTSETVSDPAPPVPAAAPTTDCRIPVTPAQPPQTTTTRAGRRVRFNPRYL